MKGRLTHPLIIRANSKRTSYPPCSLTIGFQTNLLNTKPAKKKEGVKWGTLQPYVWGYKSASIRCLCHKKEGKKKAERGMGGEKGGRGKSHSNGW